MSSRLVLFCQLLNLAVFTGLTVPTAAAQATSVQIPPTSTWFRQSIQISGMSPEATELRINLAAVTSVYLNGQRLVRNQALTGTTAWKVGSLLRSGANGIAISIAAAEQPRTLTVWLNSPSQLKLQPSNPKVTAETPPVGWQQTDFNDRDWKAPARIPAASPSANSDDVTELAWQPTRQRSQGNRDDFQFVDGDHVVLLGGTFIERAQGFGHLETALSAAAGTKQITFRNLGWSADTVFAESRGIFDSPQKGYERMIEHVRAEEPTVIILCYGQNEALSFAAGAEGLKRFRQQLAVLSHDLATTGAQLVFLSPHPFVSMPDPLPEATRWNARLAEFRDAIRTVAEAEDIPFVDLFHRFVQDMELISGWLRGSSSLPTLLEEHPELNVRRNVTWTDNGMHWNDVGYRCAAQIVAARLLNTPLSRSQLRINTVDQTLSGVRGTIRDATWTQTPQPAVRLAFRPEVISVVPLLVQVTAGMMSAPVVAVQEGDSGPAQELSELRIDDRQDGTTHFVAGSSRDYERLRALIVRKNELYFHRWRPQNITYLFGFRKHEQGNNASEIATFDPLIDDLEQQIQTAKVRTWRTISVVID